MWSQYILINKHSRFLSLDIHKTAGLMRNLISFIGGLAWGYLTFRRQVPGGISICRDFKAQTIHNIFFYPNKLYIILSEENLQSYSDSWCHTYSWKVKLINKHRR